MKTIAITGGAGFIGTNLVDKLLKLNCYKIIVIDNLSNSHSRFESLSDKVNFVDADLRNLTVLKEAFKDVDTVYHLAANSDISASAKDTFIDVQQTILNTFNVLEAIRFNDVNELVYTSGSGVYGDLGELAPDETHGPLNPVSMYGATKLSAEAMISAYSHLFCLNAYIFRFANVVGPSQTHGVSYDFVNRLLKDKTFLNVLGDGWQSKSYVHVSDVVNAMLVCTQNNVSEPINVYNVSSGDYVSVRDIVKIVLEIMDLNSTKVSYEEKKIGWPGDIPVVRFDDSKIRTLGWDNEYNSAEAIQDSVRSQLALSNV